MSKVLLVDFSDFHDGWVTTVTDERLAVREPVVVRDAAGNMCDASVMRIEPGGKVILVLDLTTMTSGPNGL